MKLILIVKMLPTGTNLEKKYFDSQKSDAKIYGKKDATLSSLPVILFVQKPSENSKINIAPLLTHSLVMRNMVQKKYLDVSFHLLKWQ